MSSIAKLQSFSQFWCYIIDSFLACLFSFIYIYFL